MSTGRLRIAAQLLMAAALTASASCMALPGSLVPVSDDGPKAHVETARNLRYAKARALVEVAGNRLLDVYRPAGLTGAPVVLFIHGGAWKLGDKALHPNVGRALAERGVLVFSANYGLAPIHPHPEQVRDVALAFDWVRKNAARFGGDPDRVFLFGHSAGGHLVALLALNPKYLEELDRTPDEIAGVIGMSGVYQVLGTGPIFGGVFENKPDVLRDASPAMHVGRKQPPFLLFYSERDLPSLDTLAIDLDTRLRQAHSPTRLMRLPGVDHNTEILRFGSPGDVSLRAVMAFIRENER